MDIPDHKNITGKLLVRKGIHLKKPGSTQKILFTSYGNFDDFCNT